MKITEYVHALKIPFKITFPTGASIDRFVCIYLICLEKIYLIDSGVASSKQIIFDYIKDIGRSPDEIITMILTHAHPDHIGAAKLIREETNCQIIAHKNAKAWIENTELQFEERPVPGFQDLVSGSVNVDKLVDDGDFLDLEGDTKLEVFHTPGHSKGSIALLLNRGKALFSADSIPLMGSFPIYDDADVYVRSIMKLKAIEEIEYLLSAWDEPRKGAQAYKVMDEGIGYLQSIHNKVIEIADKSSMKEPMALCKKFVQELRLPLIMVNPLVAKSLWSNYNLRGKRDLAS